MTSIILSTNSAPKPSRQSFLEGSLTLGNGEGVALGRLIVKHSLDVCLTMCAQFSMLNAIRYRAPWGPPRWSGHLPLARASFRGDHVHGLHLGGLSQLFPLLPQCLGEPRGQSPRAACCACCSVWYLRRGCPWAFASIMMHNTRSTSLQYQIPPRMRPARPPAHGGPSMCDVSRGPGAGGSQAVCEGEASFWSPLCSVVPETGCL